MFVINKETDDDNLYVIVLVHGYESSSIEMRFYEKRFIELFNIDNKSFIILNSLSREGKTSKSISYQVNLLIEEIEGFLNGGCIKDIIDFGKKIILTIVGHSMGGVVVFDAISETIGKDDWMKRNGISRVISGIVTAPILGVRLDSLGLEEFVEAISKLRLIFNNNFIRFAINMVPNFDVFIQYLNIFEQAYIGMDPDRSVIDSLKDLKKSIRDGKKSPVNSTLYITAKCEFTQLVSDQFGFDYNLLKKFNSLINRVLFLDLPNLDIIFNKLMGGAHDGLVPYSSMVPIIIPAGSEEICYDLSHSSILRSSRVVEEMYRWFMQKV